MTGYIEHHNRERPHQGIGNDVIQGSPGLAAGSVECTERLGGILKHYRRAALERLL